MAQESRSSSLRASNKALAAETGHTTSPSTSGGNPSPSQEVSDSTTANVFGCNQCPRKFTRRENLTRHEKTHSAPWAHRCVTCGKGFARSDLLSRHEASHVRWAQHADRPSRNISNKRRKQSSYEEDFASMSTRSPDHSNGPRIEMSLHSDLQDMQMNTTPLTLESHGNGNAISPQSTENSIQNHPQPSFSRPKSINDSSSMQQDALFSFQGSHNYQQSAHNPGFLATNSSDLTGFDLSRFLLPNNSSGMEDMSYEWFSNDFYSAVQETGEDFGLGNFEDSMYRPFSNQDHDLGQHSVNQGSLNDPAVRESNLSGGESGRISRMASPPNEASEEDKWAFAWDPKSRAILHAAPIHIPLEHPLWKKHNSRFDISEPTYQKVQRLVTSRMEGITRNSTLTLPTILEANIFIGLYFEHFSPQMPVLHHSTIDTNEDLPPPLLSAILVIGAIYSNLQGTRRFAIVLMDIIRWHLQVAIECDNSLMRDPKIIFAETLICYAGLFSGNKRGFELAEVTRAIVVKQVRSASFWRADGRTLESDSASRGTRWLQWVQQESHRRLFWVVYALDYQFPALLYLPAMFSMGEVCELCCPCDEEFWAAPSARHWTSLLGPAMIPPARVFSAAAAPFVLSHWNSSESSQQASRDLANRMPIVMLNDWSAFLVLVTLQNKIFQFSQERLFWTSYFGEDDEAEHDDDSPVGESEDGFSHQEFHGPKSRRNIRRLQLKDALSSWQDAYLSNAPKNDSHATSVHFRQSSFIGHVLALILLDVPFTDIQASFGKNGEEGMAIATRNLRRWMNTHSRIAEDIVYTAVETIEYAVTKRIRQAAPEQLIIAIFLCYALIWNFATIASRSSKQRLFERLATDGEAWKSPQVTYIRTALESETNGAGISREGNVSAKGLSWGILRSAAQCLTQLGTLGAALNLALLLQRRSEM